MAITIDRMANSRQDAIDTAERLFRAQGYAGTGLAQILEESGSPKGSFYFNFPGGKHELALEALKLYGERLDTKIRDAAAAQGEDPVGFVRYICSKMARELEASGWTASCLAHQLGNELAHADTQITAAISSITQTWIASMAVVMQRVAHSREEARMLATGFLAALSGARSMARIVGSKVPFDSVAETMSETLKAADARRNLKPGRPRSARLKGGRVLTH
jgi:TetR/AcrR family transcriptional regulator, lmrAB and yxaGH operons repressor